MVRTRKHSDMQKKKPTLSPNKSPEFFKVFLKQLSSRRLRIPPAFIEHFDGRIPKNVILKDKGGRCSHGELEQLKDGVFIDSGWESFVNDHSIEHGDFLILKYEGESVFNVKIFGTNGCIKEEAVVTGEPTSRVKVEEEAEEEAEKPPKVSNVGKRCGDAGLNRYSMRRNGSMRSDAHKLFESRGLKFPINPCFVGCLTMRHDVYIPKPVIRNHGIKLKKEIVIRKKNGKIWPAKVCYRKDGRIVVSSGWINFLRDNKLSRKDQCVFEFLIGRGGICKELRAHIFQAGRGRRRWARP